MLLIFEVFKILITVTIQYFQQLFETGKKGVFACFKCQPISLVPEITLGQDSSHEVIIDSSEVPNDDDSPELIQDSSTLHIGQDISLTSSGSQEVNKVNIDHRSK